ncbi:head GIN domain-containing protein [Methanofollis aquaemaris]|nr:head GIN domain-containing protein [Methanofollis aquaemaris]
MIRYLFAAAAVLLVLVLTAGCVQPPCTVGSGNVVSETRDVGAFQSVELNTFATVMVTQGASGPLVIEAEDNIVPLVQTRVSDGVLVVDLDAACVRNTRPVIVRVTMEEVQRLSVSGSGTVQGENEIVAGRLETAISGSGNLDLGMNVTTLETTISGSGEARLSGTAAEHNAGISGSGALKGFDLTTERTNLVISGSGAAEVLATGALDVQIAGSGAAIYRGDPVVTQEISGSGSLVRAG